MSKGFRFFIYLLERYAEHLGVTADVAYRRLSECGLVDYALGMYELYHVEALEMPLPTLTAGCPAALGRCDLQKAGPVLSSWLNAFLIECLALK